MLPHVLPIELYYWKKENLEFGIMDADISGYKVHITDMERSVCDAEVSEQDWSGRLRGSNTYLSEKAEP